MVWYSVGGKMRRRYYTSIFSSYYQTEVLFRSHDQMGHQWIDKVQQRILHRFDWPGLRKACERWMNACLSCLQLKDTRKMKFPLKSVESSEFNEIVQIDHQKICLTDSGCNQILIIIDHFTKLAEAVPCQTASAEETCYLLITHWISRYGCPMTIQSDNGKAFVGDLTKELMRRSHIAQAYSTNLPSSKKRISGEAEQNFGENAQGILLEIHDRLGQTSATIDAALNNRDQSFHDVDWQGESNAPDLLLSGIFREEDVAAGVREASGQETTKIERAL